MLNFLLPAALQWVAVLPAQVGWLAIDMRSLVCRAAGQRLERVMKMLVRKRWFFVIGTILASGTFLCGSQGLAAYPRWINKPPQERKAIIVVGVATAHTLEDGQRTAILNAANQVAAYIGETVSGSGASLRTLDEHRLEDEVKSSIEHTPLQGGLVKEWYFEEVAGRYRVFALVNYPRAEIEKIKARLSAEETEGFARAKMAIRRGQLAWERGSVAEALRTFSEALLISRGVGQRALEIEASSKIHSLLQSLELSIVSGEGQVIEPSKKQQGTLVVSVTSRLEEKMLPVEGIPIRFNRGDGMAKTESVLADSNGKAQLVLQSAWLSIGMQRVKASIDKAGLFASIGLNQDVAEDNDDVSISQVTLPSVIFTLKVVPHLSSTRILLLIEETNMGRLSNESIVMQTLSEALQQAGFLVVAEHEIGKTNLERFQVAIRKERLWPLRPELAHEADLVLIGTALTRKGSDNMGVVISSQADLFIRAVDLKSGDVVAQKNVLSQAGFGDTPELAGIKALSEAGRLAAESLVDQLTLREEGKTDADR